MAILFSLCWYYAENGKETESSNNKYTDLLFSSIIPYDDNSYNDCKYDFNFHFTIIMA